MNIDKLGRLLKKSHSKTRSWNKTGAAFHITGGMAYRIANEGYEPVNPVVRIGLGLGLRVCPKCLRKITVPHKPLKRIADKTPKELLWCLQNRKEMV